MTTIGYDHGESEIYAAEYHGDTHLFEDPGARRLWIDEIIAHGANEADFELWEA